LQTCCNPAWITARVRASSWVIRESSGCRWRRPAPVYADGAWHEAAIYTREALPLGAEIAGPAVIQQIER
jgi:N-methylhydantoinase A/oxoprolinase/acetone carboxylase beta subunit